MAAGEQVALEPALAEMLGEDLHHPAVRREALVVGAKLGEPEGAVGDEEDVAEPVRGRLVGAKRRKFCGFLATSRRKPPSTRVASLV